MLKEISYMSPPLYGPSPLILATLGAAAQNPFENKICYNARECTLPPPRPARTNTRLPPSPCAAHAAICRAKTGRSGATAPIHLTG